MDAAAWDDRYRAASSLWSTEANLFLTEEVRGLTPGRALDLGCGEGRNAVWLAERGWDVTAVDFSRVALDRGVGLATERGVAISFVEADLLTYEPPRESFDLVVLMYIQLPVQPLVTVLDRAAAAVAPRGTLLVVAHDRSNLDRGYGGPSTADVLYTAEDVVQRLDGFEIVRAGDVERPVATPDGPRLAIDCLVRAQRS